MRSIELFVGAGGLALGVSRASFQHLLVADRDKHACATIRENASRGVAHVANWPLKDVDVRNLNYAEMPEDIELLAGGPPCQPFSLGGKHRAHRDERDMFSEVTRAIRVLRPKAILVENVQGLVRPAFHKYFSCILLQLTYPEISPDEDEHWRDHLSRLERHHTSGSKEGLRYQVVFRVLNAADYGVPQVRQRVVIVGFRSDLGVEWSFPKQTHSKSELLFQQWITGEYWERHCVPKKRRPELPSNFKDQVLKLSDLGVHLQKPWQTVRDAIADLPAPREGKTEVSNHQYQPGARSYAGHTGSPLDWPAKTLKAGVHGVPGGENMLVLGDGSVRYFTVREAARLQVFPDEYVFTGAWSENMRQLGNAVPVQLGEVVARHIRAKLSRAVVPPPN